MWSWICPAQCAPFLTPSSLWSAIPQRVPENRIPVASYGESQVQVVEDAHGEGWKVEVWYWSNAAGDLQKVVDRFEKLDVVLNKIGFEEH